MQRQIDALSEMSESKDILIISTVWETCSVLRPDFFDNCEKVREEHAVGIRFLVNEGLRDIVERAKVSIPR